MKKVFILIGVLVMVTVTLNAQNEIDALRYSYNIPGGTARSMAMGGSFGALGADASSIIFNPAGMGVFRTSDFTFSPSFVLTNTEADFLGSRADDYDFNFNINNLSYIGSIPINNENELTSVNLGMS